LTDLDTRIANLSAEKRALLTLRLQKLRAAEAARQALPRREDPSAPAPLSFAQQRLWFLDQMEPGNPFYNVPAAVRLTGDLDVSALESSLGEILRRHAVLRTGFTTQDGQPVQVVHPPAPLSLEILDLSHIPPEHREEEARRLAAQEAVRPFDLSQPPLLRSQLIRLDDSQHILLLTLHHIVSDGWSLGVLVRELAALYPAFHTGQASPIPELPVQYADYAVWQRGWLQGQTLEGQLSYWKQQLSSAPQVLELPTARPRPAVQDFRGAREPFEFPASLTRSLQALCQREDVTLFMALLAGFETLLYRLSGQSDFCLATPIANRTRAELESMVGFFVNTLVLRARLDGAPTFRELLQRVRETALGAYAHQDLPFEMLVDALQPQRSLTYTPLFQVMFALQNAPLPPLSLPGLSVQVFEIDPGVSRFDLTLSIYEQSGCLAGFVEYSTSLFDRWQIQDLLVHYRRLLEQAAAGPDLPITRLDLLTPAERQRILAEWNATHSPLPELCIHQRFEQQVYRQPHAPALIFEDSSLTYAGLNDRANRLARRLRALGVGPEALVGICLERSFERIIAILGILKAGGAYLPLDPTYPRDRLAFMLEDSGAVLLLTQASLASDLPKTSAGILVLDRDEQPLEPESGEDLYYPVAQDNLAYVIYTSGSTGKPKGTLLHHRGLVNMVEPQLEIFQAGPGCRVLQFASFSFDASVWEVFTALACGGTLVLAPQEVLASPVDLLELFSRQRVNLALLPPSLLAMLPPAHLPDLHTLVTGGEACSAEIVARWAPGRRLINAYGPTEITVYASLHICDADEPGAPPIGRPVSNTALYVLDEHQQPVPPGVPGELYISGAGVARGYHNRPELTAEKFLPDPFSPIPGKRMYRSGDRVRYRPDGCLEYLGRFDQQVKLRGFRVELGEIEAALLQHPGIAQAVVAVREDRPGDKRLAAYLVAGEKAAQPPAADLRAHLKRGLPDYMLPSAFIFLEALPLTPSGKVDRKSLPVPDTGDPESPVSQAAPRTPTEEILAGIWARLLGAPGPIPPDANFFELGGHSLLAAQLSTRVRDVFQIELPVRTLFEAPALADYAVRVEAARRSGEKTCVSPILPAPRQEEMPLSFAQQSLWFLDQMEPGNPFYNIPAAVRLSGDLDQFALERSLEEILRRHEVLRTTFHLGDGKPYQVVQAAQPQALPLDVLEDAGPQEQPARIQAWLQDEARKPFDLSEGPLLRARLLRLAPGGQEHILLLTLHHIAADGGSLEVLVRELAGLYAAYHSGQEPHLPDLPVQYVDYAAWQRSWLQGEVLEEQLSYWQERLAGIPAVLELPTDHPRPAVQAHRGRQLVAEFSEELSGALRRLSQQEGVTLFMTLLAAFQVMLARYTGQEDIPVGSPAANRGHTRLENLVGFFANTLVLRGDLSGAPTFHELLARIRETALGAYAHQDTLLTGIARQHNPEGSQQSKQESHATLLTKAAHSH